MVLQRNILKKITIYAKNAYLVVLKEINLQKINHMNVLDCFDKNPWSDGP